MATVTFSPSSSVNNFTPIRPNNGAAITPSDADVFSQGVEVYVGGAGVVTCTPAGASQATTVAVTVPAGGHVPFKVSAVKATGTTATLLIALF